MRVELVGQAEQVWAGKVRLPDPHWAELEEFTWATLELVRQGRIPPGRGASTPRFVILYARDVPPNAARLSNSNVESLSIRWSSGGACACLVGEVTGPDKVRYHRIGLRRRAPAG